MSIMRFITGDNIESYAGQIWVNIQIVQKNQKVTKV